MLFILSGCNVFDRAMDKETELLTLIIIEIFDEPQGEFGYTITSRRKNAPTEFVEFLFYHLDLTDINVKEGMKVNVVASNEMIAHIPAMIIVYSWFVF